MLPGPFDDLITANKIHAVTHQPPATKGAAGRQLAVITCMDCRVSPAAVFRLDPGDAVILRTAGARVTDDVLRALVVATHLLDVTRVVVMGHTDCRMTTNTDEELHHAIGRMAAVDTRSLDFGTISDQRVALARDVQRIRSSPYLPVALDVLACVYDLGTGCVTELST